MSGFSLLAPLGLVALVGLPLVVLYHMRHTTPTVRPVPTLRFWLAAVDQQTEQARFRRPPLTLLLLLHLIIVGLLAFALMRPAAIDAWAGLGRRTEPTHVIILLDGSTSMVATDTASGRTRFEEARVNALSRVSDLREGDVATVVLLGTHPTTLEATDAAGLKALRDRLGRLPAPGGRADLNAALRLARDLVLPGLEDQIVLLSDGALTVDPTLVEAVGAPIEFQRVGRSTTSNLAITDLSARSSPDNPGQEQLYTRIVNFGDEPVTARVVVSADGIEVEQQSVTIEANDDVEQIVKQLPVGAAKVTVTAQAEDALQADNRASLVLSRDADLGLRILLVSDLPGWLQRALAVLPGAQLTTQSTSDSLTGASDGAAPGSFDLVVYEGFTPQDAATLPDAPIVFVNPPRDGVLPTDGAKTMLEPSVARIVANDPLLLGVDLTGVTFGETPIHNLSATDTEVVGADDRNGPGAGPLIYRGRMAASGQPMIVLTFDLNDQKTNLPQRIAFPILIANMANELAPSPLPSAVPLGDPLRYRPRADAAKVRIAPPTGEPIDLAVAVGEEAANGAAPTAGGGGPLREVVYSDTGQPGEYRITELDAAGTESGGGTFVVNAGHTRESDLRANQELPGVLATARAVAESGTRASLSDLWPTLVAVALAVLGLEWLWSVLPRRRRQRRRATLGQPA
ncbi:MAG: hypothetical protein QOF33_3487 [Thermomicrobiales bacterium]|nr:hypothetical protein [Thermomicrobiales bacterium]